MTALGSMTYGAKQYLAGREISDDPKKLIIESLDRSGAMGYFWDANNMIEKASRGNLGVNPAIGGPPMSRYQSRNIWGAILGPTVGTVEDAFTITGALAAGEMTKREAHNIRTMLPYNTVFYIRKLLDQLEAKATEGLPE